MVRLGTIFSILILLAINPAHSNGWETNANFKLHARTLQYDSDAWLMIQRRDRWNRTNDHSYEHWEFNIGDLSHYKLFKYGVGYRYIRSNKVVEHRPHVFLTPQLRMYGDKVTILIRNKLEYRIRSTKTDGIQYKIRPTIKYLAYDTNNIKIIPYFADEMTYSFINNTWDGNKLDAGIVFKVANYSIKPYYQYEHNIHTGNKKESRVGLTMGVNF